MTHYSMMLTLFEDLKGRISQIKVHNPIGVLLARQAILAEDYKDLSFWA